MPPRLPGRIAVITGDPSLPDPTKLHQRYGPDDLAVHEKMREAFATLGGVRVEVFEHHETLFDDLAAWQPELVVNFCDTGFCNRPDQEIHIATQLELMGIPYTGAAPRGMLMCFDKQVVRLVAQSLGVPVPDERFVEAPDLATATVGTYPALIKPNAADGSVGITKDAVVRNDAEARHYLVWIASTLPGKDVLIQEYLPGAEYGLGVIGNADSGLQALPMLEVDFSALPEHCEPILSFESKVDPDSPWWQDIRFREASLAPEEQQMLTDRCQRLFARLSLRDYGRFDFRTAADGTIKLMEVNPNPAWGFDAKLAIMAGLANLSYAALLEKLVATAWQRITRAASAH